MNRKKVNLFLAAALLFFWLDGSTVAGNGQDSSQETGKREQIDRLRKAERERKKVREAYWLEKYSLPRGLAGTQGKMPASHAALERIRLEREGQGGERFGPGRVRPGAGLSLYKKWKEYPGEAQGDLFQKSELESLGRFHPEELKKIMEMSKGRPLPERGREAAASGVEHSSVGAEYISLTIDAPPTNGEINPADDQDLYQFAVTSPGWYKVETWLVSLEDNYMYLYGPSDPVIYITEDDDSAEGRAAKIWRYFDAGVYYVVITSFDGAYAGIYTIAVTTAGTPSMISGRVTDEAGNGLEGILIYAYDMSKELAVKVNSDTGGNYHLSPLEARSYKIAFYHGGLNFLNEWFNNKSGFTDADEVVVTAGGTTANINAQLAVGGSISGRVVNSSGAGIGNIRVATYGSAGDFISTRLTNADGDYLVPGLNSGSYRICFNGSGMNYITEWYNDRANRSSADLVSVTAGSNTPNINAELALGGSISGRVTNAATAGIAGISVHVENLDYFFQVSATTDADGNYSANGLPTGSYKVHFYNNGSSYISEWYNDKGDFASADLVVVTAGGDTPDIDAELALGGNISGRVTNASVAGIAGIGVYVYDLDRNNLAYTPTDIFGNYSANGLPTGSYNVLFHNNGLSYISEWYNDKADFDAADSVTVNAGSDTLGINAMLAHSGSISGRVTDMSAKGIAGLEVNVCSFDLGGWYYTYTDVNGDYKVAGLPGGNYYVNFWPYLEKGQNYAQEWYDNKASFGFADPVSVTSGSDTPNIDAQLADAGSIGGCVRNISGSGLANVDVLIYESGGGLVNLKNTGSDGSYMADNLPVGSYKVKFYDYSGAYIGEWYNDKFSFDSADPVTIMAGGITPVNALLAAVGDSDSLTITAPNGGESWTAGTGQEITWTSTGGVGNINIIYTYDNGSTWHSVIEDTANDGSHLWTIPDTPSTHCFLRVQENDGYPGDYSDAAFTIVSAVIPPVISGTILYNSSPLAGVVMSGLPGNPATDDSGLYTSPVDYDWSGTVTPTLDGYSFTPANRMYISITSDQTSQNYIAAQASSLELTSPNGWEHWTLGTTKAITWNAVNYTGTVRLVLFKNGVRFGNIVANLPASAGSYSWTVGQTYDSGMAPEGSDYRLYLRSTDGTIIDPSDYRLGLIEPAQLEMTSPNGGESWELGTTQNITWNANGYSGTVRLILFQKAAKVGQIAANLPADQGSYAWTVGTHQAGTAPAGILYSIRLLAGDGSQDDFSDGPLTLIENDSLIVDHHHTQMNAIPSEWLEHAKQHRLLVLGALGNDPVTLGLRLLGSRDARLATASNSNSLGLVLNEGSWLPQGAALDPQEWRWSLERTILDSQATVAIVRPDEGALLAGKLNAESYLQVMSELAERLPQVKLARVTASMDEPNEIMAKFNRQVRESALRNRGILLDTADIESWRNNRQQLVRDVPVRHPAYRAASGVPATDNLTNQGSAAWWLLARLAGWEGEIPLGTNMR